MRLYSLSGLRGDDAKQYKRVMDESICYTAVWLSRTDNESFL